MKEALIDLKNELFNFNYRELEVPFSAIFPRANIEEVKQRFLKFQDSDAHKTIYNVLKALAAGEFLYILSAYGFWDEHYSQFSGHCHQCTPALGLVLHSLGFEVSFLEGFRIREHFTKTGMIEQVPPQEELNPKNKQEFCSIKRIPYCCLEVQIKGKNHYISAKHLSASGENAKALLTPECYSSFSGVFRHQNDGSKSGIYLNKIIPENNISKANFNRQVVWMKQTFNDEKPELFCTFLRMKLV